MRKAGHKGLGVFAARSIARGTRVISYRGKARGISEIPKWQWDHAVQVDYDRYVVPRPGSPGWCINHSCDPNCVIQGGRDLAVVRDIGKGEELNFDYSTNVGWRGFLMPCRCGSETCRGVVLSYDHLGEAAKRKYDGKVSPFLLRPRGRETPTLF